MRSNYIQDKSLEHTYERGICTTSNKSIPSESFEIGVSSLDNQLIIFIERDIKSIDIRIVDVLGRVIDTFSELNSTSRKIQFNFNAPSGIYFMEALINKQIHQSKPFYHEN